ncbi:2-dehydropantoate 2-reductase [Pedobacter sp. JY14-1]|uniref:ketopantoate reductase family protein n=1 Tax=Pedobacter sp. JY14-1 TaxID=3034151 RepID=UPI0023E0CCC0|nr:2-dehydropantoate 2-reductase [Pedobacter sp. JY14-1]
MIYIVGTGAIGKALAVFLKLSGQQVTLVRGSVDDLPETRETVRVRISADQEMTADLPVQTLNSVTSLEGPVLVAAKSYGNENIAEKLAKMSKDVPVCLLQNGLNIELPFTGKGFRELYRCVLMVTSQFAGDGTIAFKPVAACPVGVISGQESVLSALLDQLQNRWFTFRMENPIQPLIWKKVIANCVFNSICPLLETDNGIFHRNPGAMRIAESIIMECIGIAGRFGIVLDDREVRDMVLAISHASDGQYISTLQDIRSKRPTEISTLNHAIVGLARSLGAESLVPQTRILGDLTEIKSRL